MKIVNIKIDFITYFYYKPVKDNKMKMKLSPKQKITNALTFIQQTKLKMEKNKIKTPRGKKRKKNQWQVV